MMVRNQDVQKKAQAEIDGLVGRGRLPTFENMSDLPYTRAVVWETMRCMPSVPSCKSI